MADGITIRVEDAPRLAADLRRISRDLGDMKGANATAAQIVIAAARAAAPKRSGRLAASLTAEVGRDRATITSPLVYAPVIHGGWNRKPNKRRKIWGGPIKANPFLSRAAQGSEGAWMKAYENHVRKAIGG